MKNSAYRNALKEITPLVQCITNTVVQQFEANVLLACGAAPAMVDHEADAASFAQLASALQVNFGTPTSHHYLAADAAATAMNEQGKPWMLDPVGFGAGHVRTHQIMATLAKRPTVVRGNASEIAGVAGAGAGGRGTDSTDAVDDVLPAAMQVAQQTGHVVAVSGQVDAIVSTTDHGATISRVHGGHALMPLVIGTGCSLGALSVAYVAAASAATAHAGVEAEHAAVVAAHAHFAAAGKIAGEKAQAPGSFAVAFLDALYSVSDAELDAVVVETSQA